MGSEGGFFMEKKRELLKKNHTIRYTLMLLPQQWEVGVAAEGWRGGSGSSWSSLIWESLCPEAIPALMGITLQVKI